MSNIELRSNFAKEMFDEYNKRNEQLEQLEQIDKLPISEELKENAKNQIYKNFDEKIEEIQGQAGYKEAKQSHLAEIQTKVKLAKSKKEKEKLQKEYEEKLAAADEQIAESIQGYEQAQIAHRGQVENKPEITESIDTPADVLEFRRGFVDGIKEYDDVTEEKLNKIVEIGEKLVKSKEFHFEKSEYGNIGVLKLGGKTMKFLNIAHPQDFNNQLTHKIKDESLTIFDYKQQWGCRCENTQDLVHNTAMPGGRAEDKGIVELLDKVKDSTGLGQLTRAEMENTVRGILKDYCNQNGVIFDNNNYMLLYMYLMGPKGGYGWQWLADCQNYSRSYFRCHNNYRCFDSDAYGSIYASFFLGLLV